MAIRAESCKNVFCLYLSIFYVYLLILLTRFGADYNLFEELFFTQAIDEKSLFWYSYL